jgi:hypothetical protein
VPDPMTEETGVSRREFTLQSALALLSTCVITLDGCGSGYKNPNNPTPTPTPTPTDVTGNISANHGHLATIKAADITAGKDIALDIQGMASHPHTVQISQADLQMLKNRQPITKESTNNNGHMHSVTFTPA